MVSKGGWILKATQSIKVSMTATEAIQIMSIIESLQQVRSDFLAESDHEILDQLYHTLASSIPLEMLEFEFTGDE